MLNILAWKYLSLGLNFNSFVNFNFSVTVGYRSCIVLDSGMYTLISYDNTKENV